MQQHSLIPSLQPARTLLVLLQELLQPHHLRQTQQLPSSHPQQHSRPLSSKQHSNCHVLTQPHHSSLLSSQQLLSL
jgi:hypothetical protein